MKKSIFSYFSYLVLLLLAVGTLASCDGTEDGVNPAPSITVNPETAEVEVGQTATFTYQVVSTENRLTEVRIVYPAASGIADEVFTTFSDKNLYSNTHTFPAQAAAGSVTFNIEARDKDGNVTRKPVTVTVKAVVNPIALSSFPAILLGAQANSATGSFLDADGSGVYKYANGEAKAQSAIIDMAYLQGSESNGQGAVIGSPIDNSIMSIYDNATYGVQTWSTKNATKFKNTTLSEADFNAILPTEGQKVNTAYANGTQPDNDGTTNEGSKSRVNKLTAGKVFAFQTANGKNGLAYVVSVNSGNSGDIKLNIKVVK